MAIKIHQFMLVILEEDQSMEYLKVECVGMSPIVRYGRHS